MSISANPTRIEKVTQLMVTVIQNAYQHNELKMPVTPQKSLIINSAYYYDPAEKEYGINVTNCLNALINNNKLAFIVDNSVFSDCGQDPARFIMKEIEIIFTYNDITSTLICKEKDTVILQGY